MFSPLCFLYGWDWGPFEKKEISTLFIRRGSFSLDILLIFWVGSLEFLGLSKEMRPVVGKAFLWFVCFHVTYAAFPNAFFSHFSHFCNEPTHLPLHSSSLLCLLLAPFTCQSGLFDQCAGPIPA